MPKQTALLIGLDRCDDALVGLWPGNEARTRAAQQLLGHPCLGAFQENDLHCLLGARVHVDGLQSSLHRYLIHKADPDERLFVQLSVPLLAMRIGDETRHYFVTRDMLLRRLLDNPFASLSVEQLVADYLRWSPAAEILLVLDSPLIGEIERVAGDTRPHIKKPERSELRLNCDAGPGRAVVATTVQSSDPIGAHVVQVLSESVEHDDRPRVCGRDLLHGLGERYGDSLRVTGSEPKSFEIELSYPMTEKAKVDLASRRSFVDALDEPHPLEVMAERLHRFCHESSDANHDLHEFIEPERAHDLSHAQLEASVLDSWRMQYGTMPPSIEARRRELFDRELERMTTWFQPIIRLGRKQVRIAGWEALARDPETQRIPEALFECVEIWGEPFVSELDAHLAGTAVELFHHLIQRDPRLKTQTDLYELSVNVYPESLLSDRYFERLAELIACELILPERLVLEISEKQELPLPDPETGEDVFRDHLKRYVRDLGVHFSIDDLGEGHASIDRLQDLDPLHVKIDRSILRHEDVASELAYLIGLVGPGHLSPPRIVVEGVDEDCPLTLPELYEVGVKFVQGFSIARPAPDLYPLDEDLSSFLAARMREELGPRVGHS